MITLYHHPKTRSTRFIFLLEELEAPYTIRMVSTRTRDGGGAVDPANPHPHGKVPAISDDGVIVFESPAIALYLTDAFPQNRLGPRVGERERGAYLSWLAYYSGVLEPAVMCKFMNVAEATAHAAGRTGERPPPGPKTATAGMPPRVSWWPCRPSPASTRRRSTAPASAATRASTASSSSP